MIVRIIRDEGSQRGAIVAADMPLEEALALIKSTPLPSNQVQQVSCRKRRFSRTPNHKYDIVAVDCGIKHSIISQFNSRGCNVTIVPYNTTLDEIMAFNPDGIFISNGPGNPAELTEVVDIIKAVKGKIPVFGIEFGNLLLGMAFDGKTEKLTHDHRGAQPVKCKKTGKVYISSQNHGYALLEEGLKNAEVIYSNVNDGSCEGVEYEGYNAFGVQFAPESCSLTGEENPVYAKFFALMKKEKENA
jgi:carbamoyl-phosphate synthase small subunit